MMHRRAIGLNQARGDQPKSLPIFLWVEAVEIDGDFFLPELSCGHASRVDRINILQNHYGGW
jgi:hypothetical protein